MQITKKGYWAKQEASLRVHDSPAPLDLVALLESQGEVGTVSAHLNYFGILDTASGDSELVMVRGVEQRTGSTPFLRGNREGISWREISVSPNWDWRSRGKRTSTWGVNSSPSTVSSDGAQNALPLKVKGMIGSYSADFDSKILRIPLETAQILAGADGVQEIVVPLKDGTARSGTGSFPCSGKGGISRLPPGISTPAIMPRLSSSTAAIPG